MVAGIIGIILVILTMMFYYRLAGVMAVAALSLYVILLMGGLAVINATLTLPGIAGLILSIGMAVDANVLIFERIREELQLGRGARSAVNEGFQHALSAIVDANLTTLITAIILFYFGTGRFAASRSSSGSASSPRCSPRSSSPAPSSWSTWSGRRRGRRSASKRNRSGSGECRRSLTDSKAVRVHVPNLRERELSLPGVAAARLHRLGGDPGARHRRHGVQRGAAWLLDELRRGLRRRHHGPRRLPGDNDRGRHPQRHRGGRHSRGAGDPLRCPDGVRDPHAGGGSHAGA
jgi:hypothetical protein